MWKNVHTGRVWKYGDDINTDVIYPGKYTYTDLTPEEMAKHALEDLDPEFANQVQPGDIVVAGRNFGCGSSREQAVTCLKHAGVGAVIAKSFARIYGRLLRRKGENSAWGVLISAAVRLRNGHPGVRWIDPTRAQQAGDRVTEMELQLTSRR